MTVVNLAWFLEENQIENGEKICQLLHRTIKHLSHPWTFNEMLKSEMIDELIWFLRRTEFYGWQVIVKHKCFVRIQCQTRFTTEVIINWFLLSQFNEILNFYSSSSTFFATWKITSLLWFFLAVWKDNMIIFVYPNVFLHTNEFDSR